MNDSTRSQPGRPKVYDSDAERLGAFRSRLETAGYLRKEVLVTRQTADALGQLAKAHRVTLTDAASALLEYGLQKFNEAHGEQPTAGAAPAVSAAASLTPQSLEASFASVAPAEAFSMAPPASRALRAASVLPQAASASVAASAMPPLTLSPAVASTPDEDNPIVRFFQNRRQETKK